MGREIPIEINGEEWTIRYTSKIKNRRGNPLTDLGHCVYRTKTIWIRSHQSRESEIDTVLHEVEHAQQPDLSEEAIARNAKEQTAVLKACGLI